jgi:hypothetical protein
MPHKKRNLHNNLDQKWDHLVKLILNKISEQYLMGKNKRQIDIYQISKFNSYKNMHIII